MFEFVIAGCAGETVKTGGLTGCTTRQQSQWWQRGTAPSNSLMLFASKQRGVKTVSAAFEETSMIPSRDYIFGGRRAINSLRQLGLR